MGIFLSALIATAVCVGIGHTLLRSWTCRRRLHYGVAAASLAFSPLVNLLVKKPVVGVMLGRVHLQPSVPTWPLWFAALVLLVVGISEEAIKLLPLLAPEVRRVLDTRGSAEPLAFAIGLGFAVGEIWYLAYRFYVAAPASARLPFYMLGGFVTERIATLSIHSFLVLLPLRAWRNGTASFLRWTAGAMLSHALVDTTAMLYQMNFVGAAFATLVVLGLTLACAIPFYRYRQELTPRERSATLRKDGRLFYEASAGEFPSRKDDTA
jgi:uncharacterized membrane protein YhfC